MEAGIKECSSAAMSQCVTLWVLNSGVLVIQCTHLTTNIQMTGPPSSGGKLPLEQRFPEEQRRCLSTGRNLWFEQTSLFK